MRIGLVTPFPWNVPSAVNQQVAGLAQQLRALGHQPVVIVASDDPREVQRMRLLTKGDGGHVSALLQSWVPERSPDIALLPPPRSGPLRATDDVPVVPMGHSFPVRLNGAVANLGLPIDVASRLERLLAGGGFDLVHVHEPVAPSLSFTALRESLCPVVATFHLSPLGVAAYELGQSILGRFYERLDASIVTFAHAADLMKDLFGGDYEVIPCGTSLPGRGPGRDVPGQMRPSLSTPFSGAPFSGRRYALYVYRGDGRRALRALLRDLNGSLPAGLDMIVVAVAVDSAERWPPRRVPRRLSGKVTLLEYDSDEELGRLYQGASGTILPFLGGEWLCPTVAEAGAYGSPIAGPDIPPVRDALATDAIAGGVLYSPNESGSLARALEGLLSARDGDTPGTGSGGSSQHGFLELTQRVERVYEAALERRRKEPVSGPRAHAAAQVRRVPAGILPRDLSPRWLPLRPDWINADLHVHSNYSKDCASSVEAIIATAREIGLGAVAIADHNTIAGGVAAKELANGDPIIIIAEEVKTLQGEVIGMFLEEEIPKGLSLDATLSLIKEQGGLVYIPHPFDGLRTHPSYRLLVDNLHRIDVVETYNGRMALSAFNLNAERFAAKYNIVAGAGSDAHVLQGLGTAMLRMPRFEGPEDFMAGLWEADIIARRRNLLYLQSLKLFQTTLDRVLPEE